MFCHKTPESPRNLIEALVSGAPIVGYDSPFPRDLIAAHGGGVLTPLNDVNALVDSLASLADLSAAVQARRDYWRAQADWQALLAGADYAGPDTSSTAGAGAAKAPAGH